MSMKHNVSKEMEYATKTKMRGEKTIKLKRCSGSLVNKNMSQRTCYLTNM